MPELTENQKKYVHDNHTRQYVIEMARNLSIPRSWIDDYMKANELEYRNNYRGRKRPDPDKPKEGYFNYKERENWLV